uniref:Coiled-coil domain containing 112 n=1 Tax=Sander lucioperca TaxID=283035 RepID=A0A8C9XW43_SANLU
MATLATTRCADKHCPGERDSSSVQQQLCTSPLVSSDSVDQRLARQKAAQFLREAEKNRRQIEKLEKERTLTAQCRKNGWTDVPGELEEYEKVLEEERNAEKTNLQKQLVKIHNGVRKFQRQLIDVKPTPECKFYLPAEVRALEAFLLKTGGPCGGWDQYDHQAFLKVWTKHSGQPAYRKEVKLYLPSKTLEEIEQHEDWHQELIYLQDRKREVETKHEERRRQLEVKLTVEEQLRLKREEEEEQGRRRRAEEQREMDERRREAVKGIKRFTERVRSLRITEIPRNTSLFCLVDSHISRDPSRLTRPTKGWEERMKHIGPSGGGPVLQMFHRSAVPTWRQGL